MTQCERLLDAYRRIKDTTLYQGHLNNVKQRKRDFLMRMIGGMEQQATGPKRLSEILGEESAPTNAMGLSSTVHGTGVTCSPICPRS